MQQFLIKFHLFFSFSFQLRFFSRIYLNSPSFHLNGVAEWKVWKRKIGTESGEIFIKTKHRVGRFDKINYPLEFRSKLSLGRIASTTGRFTFSEWISTFCIDTLLRICTLWTPTNKTHRVQHKHLFFEIYVRLNTS